MKLKSSLLLTLSLTVGLTLSCANAANEFKIEKFYPLGPGCNSQDFKENSLTGNAYLDVAAGNPSVVIGVVITGAENVAQQPVVVGQTVVERDDRNRPVVTSMVVNYRLSKRVGGTPRPYIQNLTLPFSENGEVFGPVQLLSPELGQALFDGLLPSPGTPPSNTIEDFVDIQMDVEFKGEWSATRNTFTTGVLTYPVRAFRSNPGICDLNMDMVDDGFGFQKFAVDPNSTVPNSPDICRYIGFQYEQYAAPAVPPCCTDRGAVGGPGC